MTTPADQDPENQQDERRFSAALAGFRGDESAARRLLGDGSPTVRAAAFGALVRMERLEAADLATAAADPEPAVRRTVCELAGRVGSLPIHALLSDTDPAVREAAAFAAGETDAVEAVELLCEIAAHDSDPLCRESAVAALGAIGDERGRAVLLGALGDVAQIRRRAVIALSGFDGDDVEAALRSHLEDRDWQVRQAVEDLLDVNRAKDR